MWCCKVLLLSLAIIAVSCKRVPFYRRDYIYLEQFEAFYKLHDAADSWAGAFDACEAEDSQLFYPTTAEEALVLQTLVTNTSKNVTDIVLGLRDDFHLGEFITIHGKTTPFPLFTTRDETPAGMESECVFLDLNNNYSKADCNQRLSFVCKKVEDVPPCPTIDKNYVYKSSTGKCYKVNNHEQTWQEAMSTCYNEAAMLVVLDDRDEAEAVGSLLSREVYYHAGVHTIVRGDDLFTIDGSRVDEKVMLLWYSYERNEKKDCGALWRNSEVAYYRTVGCDERHKFVCEMKADCKN